MRKSLTAALLALTPLVASAQQPSVLELENAHEECLRHRTPPMITNDANGNTVIVYPGPADWLPDWRTSCDAIKSSVDAIHAQQAADADAQRQKAASKKSGVDAVAGKLK